MTMKTKKSTITALFILVLVGVGLKTCVGSGDETETPAQMPQLTSAFVPEPKPPPEPKPAPQPLQETKPDIALTPEEQIAKLKGSYDGDKPVSDRKAKIDQEIAQFRATDEHYRNLMRDTTRGGYQGNAGVDHSGGRGGTAQRFETGADKYSGGRNYPCSGSKGGVLRCDGSRFLCRDGTYSRSNQSCR